MLTRRHMLVGGIATAGVCQALPANALAGALDASAFGLVPGSAEDQSAALELALLEAAKQLTPLHLPAGRYVAGDVVLPDQTWLTGVPGATALSSPGYGPILTTTRATTVRLSGLTFDGGLAAMDDGDGLVRLTNVADLAIADCDVIASGGNGVVLRGCSGQITGNRIAHAQSAALFAEDCDHLLIEGNRVTDCADNGILIWRSSPGEDGAIVRSNTIQRIGARSGGEGQWGNGINVYRAGSVLTANNRISDCEFSAVRVNSGANCQIIGNNCARLGEVAMYVEFAADGAVVADNLIAGAALGISVTNFNEGGRLAVVKGNLVRDLFTRDHYEPRGIGIGVEADTIVTGNTVENAPVIGISLGYGRYLRNVVATDNLIRNAAVGVAVSVAEGAGPAMIVDNMIAGSETGAIFGYDHSDRVTGDLARDGADRFPHLDIRGNAVT